MDAAESPLTIEDYGQTLSDYLRTRGEDALYRASQLSQKFVEAGLGPEDIIALHWEVFDDAIKGFTFREQTRAIGDAHQFLLEIMIAYGVKYKEYLEIKLNEAMQNAELQMARERERTLEADRLQREKSEILTVIAHELRTPITAARGNIDLIGRSIESGRVESVASYLGTAREALDRLSRLTADLVEASRSEPPPLNKIQLPLAPVIRQAYTWAHAAAASKGVMLTCVSPDHECTVQADPDALLSVMGNLLSNAIRYTPTGGQVTVRWWASDSWATVEVKDTGIGIPPEVQERIFDKFYRSPEARRVEARGLGLGLALVYQMIQAHKGRVDLESAPGQGSSFRISIPLAEG